MIFNEKLTFEMNFDTRPVGDKSQDTQDHCFKVLEFSTEPIFPVLRTKSVEAAFLSELRSYEKTKISRLSRFFCTTYHKFLER